MANYRKGQKSGVGVRVFAGIMAFIVLLGIAWGIGWGITGTYDVRAWATGGTSEKPDDFNPDEINKDIDSTGFVVTAAAAYGGVRLAAFSARSSADDTIYAPEGSYDIIATVTPDDADWNELEWSFEFVNPSSTWANGKQVTACLGLTPSDNTLSAKATCLAAFGEPIKITATSKDNPAAYAECICDYVKRVDSITITNPLLSFPTSALAYEVNYSAYTIDTNVVIGIGKQLNFSDSFLNYVKSLDDNTGYSWNFTRPSYEQLGTDYANNTISIITYDDWTGKQTARFSHMRFVEMSESIEEYDEYEAMCDRIDKLFKRAIANYNDTQATFDITWTSAYNGVTFSAGTKTVEVKFDAAALYVPVESVTMPGHIIF